MSGIGDISVAVELKQAISTHLDGLAKSLDGYFPTRELYPAWVRQPFTFAVETADVNGEYLDEINEIQQSQGSTATLQNNNALNVLASTNGKVSSYCEESPGIFSTICYNISLRAILFEDAGHKNKEKEQALL